MVVGSPMVKKSIFWLWQSWLLLFAVAVATLAAYYFARHTGPDQFVKRTLGIALPRSASNTQVSYRWMPDSRIIKMWAVTDVPLEDAERFARDAHLPTLTPGNSFVLPEPDPVPEWWTGLKEIDIAAAPNKWLSQTPDFRPAMFGLMWGSGKLYIFYYGVGAEK